MQKSLLLPSGYHELLQEIKGRIRTAQVRAALAVNRELVLLYWSIGRDILARQGTEGWGMRLSELPLLPHTRSTKVRRYWSS
ncbi:DUF1016 N-terminal domain-containing protein [Acidobacterium sp. S8]|uniref:DUF1016 N-terminal domain-containing protein n=1 Tax=Acidobacterium sp. S8 TaxID=1641854 RepID=UPI00131CE545